MHFLWRGKVYVAAETKTHMYDVLLCRTTAVVAEPRMVTRAHDGEWRMDGQLGRISLYTHTQGKVGGGAHTDR